MEMYTITKIWKAEETASYFYNGNIALFSHGVLLSRHFRLLDNTTIAESP